MWDRLGQIIIARPGPILLVSFLLLAPLAIKGFSTNVNYDLFAELTSDRPSVQGTDLMRRHFPAGETGPIIILAYQESARFDTPEGRKQISVADEIPLQSALYGFPRQPASRRPS